MLRRHTIAAFAAAFALAGSPAARAEDDACDGTRTVREGESLWSIARACGISVRALRDANRLDDDDVLQSGDRLHVPPPRDADRSAGTAGSDDEASGDEHRDGRHERVTLHRVQTDEEITVRLLDDDGDVRASARREVSRLLRHGPTGRQLSVSADLLRLLQRVADHWPGHAIRVQSGVRPLVRRPGKSPGNHMLGRAIDFSVEGVSNEDLRDFCRALPHAGVGYYPNSSFVHLDTRDRAWYWVDISGPGQAAHYVDPDTVEETDQERSDDGAEDAPVEPPDGSDSANEPPADPSAAVEPAVDD
jgi:uncharacterized protein YcbK (DUF882 family)